jgi:hypothetical protein
MQVGGLSRQPSTALASKKKLVERARMVSNPKIPLSDAGESNQEAERALYPVNDKKKVSVRPSYIQAGSYLESFWSDL